jgi:flagellar assembly protein FliH
MADAKSEIDSLFIPREQVKDAKRWRPAAFPEAFKPASGQSGTNSRDATPAELQSRQLDALRTRARQEGFAAGLADGRTLAEHEAKRLAALVTTMERSLAALEESVAAQLVDLAVNLARMMVRHELSIDSNALRTVVTESLRALPDSITSGEILVNPADADLIKDYMTDAALQGAWRIVADERIEAGGCRVVTRVCDIDATLATRWRRAVQMLGRTDAWEQAADSHHG